MDNLIALCADYYWEQDAVGRFSRMECLRAEPGGHTQAILAAVGFGGERAVIVPMPRALHDALSRRTPFRDIEWRWQPDPDNVCILSVTGEPVWSGEGVFSGYRGIMRDVTAHSREVEKLRRFRAAAEASGDAILLIDRETMRFIDLNDAACQGTGYARDELLQMGPNDFLMMDRQTIERDLDSVIAAIPQEIIGENKVRHRDGTIHLFEMRRRAICCEGRWLIVNTARDITRRKRAEKAAIRLGQMYAAISGTNEAILHAKTPDELFRRVCEVAVRGASIVNASVLMEEPDSDWARTAATAGVGAETLKSVRISFDPDKPEGRGMVGTAYRNCKPCVINDLANDDRMRPWRVALGKERGASGAAIPLLRKDKAVGVLLLYSRETDAFDREIVQMLERMARNIVFALDNLDRERERQQAVDALRESEEKYRSILEDMKDGYFECDLNGSYTAVNDALCRIHRCSREEALGMNYRDCTDTATADRVFRTYNYVFRTGEHGELPEYPMRRQDGSICVLQHTSIQRIDGRDGRVIGFRAFARDVTARRAAEEALRNSEEKYRSILENIEEAYYEVDLAGNLLLCNEAFCRMFGRKMEELLGLNYSEIYVPVEGEHIYAFFNEVFRTGIPKKGIDWRMLHKSGKVLLCEGSIHLVRDACGEPVGFRGMLRDVTERREMEERIQHLANHDILTGLPNRMMFNHRLADCVQRARRFNRKFAVMFADLDRFKAVNDTFGHDAGDILLKETAKRLRESVRAADFVARLAGDEFVVIVDEPGDLDQLRLVAEKVVSALRAPVTLGGAPHKVTASVGVSVFPDDGVDAEALLKHADAAMYGVKRGSKDGFRIYLQGEVSEG